MKKSKRYLNSYPKNLFKSKQNLISNNNNPFKSVENLYRNTKSPSISKENMNSNTKYALKSEYMLNDTNPLQSPVRLRNTSNIFKSLGSLNILSLFKLENKIKSLSRNIETSPDNVSRNTGNRNIFRKHNKINTCQNNSSISSVGNTIMFKKNNKANTEKSVGPICSSTM